MPSTELLPRCSASKARKAGGAASQSHVEPPAQQRAQRVVVVRAVLLEHLDDLVAGAALLQPLVRAAEHKVDHLLRGQRRHIFDRSEPCFSRARGALAPRACLSVVKMAAAGGEAKKSRFISDRNWLAGLSISLPRTEIGWLRPKHRFLSLGLLL